MNRRRTDGTSVIHKTKPPDFTFGEWLRYLRWDRNGWPQALLARNMFRVGSCFEGSASPESLKPMISKWEGNHIELSQYNLHLLATTLGVEVAELSLWVDPHFTWIPRKPEALLKLLAQIRPNAAGGEGNADNGDNWVTTR